MRFVENDERINRGPCFQPACSAAWAYRLRVCPGPEEPPHSVRSIARCVGTDECQVTCATLAEFRFSVFLFSFSFVVFYPGRHVPVPYLLSQNLIFGNAEFFSKWTESVPVLRQKTKCLKQNARPRIKADRVSLSAGSQKGRCIGVHQRGL